MLTKKIIELSDFRFQKSQDLLKQARILLDNRMFDGSINRSYYSIFYAIRAILGLVNLDSTKHSGVLALFDRYFVKTGIFDKEYSIIAHTAFDVRQDCDYDDFFYPIEDEAIGQFKKAENFINEVEKVRFGIINSKIELPTIPKK
jgi:uncharacterized protein (UPF0332 family)